MARRLVRVAGLQVAGSSGRLEFLLLWRDGRVTPGWAFCLSRSVGVRFLSFFGRWVRGRVTPGGGKSATRSLYRDLNSLFGSPDRVHYDGTVIVAIGAL